MSGVDGPGAPAVFWDNQPEDRIPDGWEEQQEFLQAERDWNLSGWLAHSAPSDQRKRELAELFVPDADSRPISRPIMHLTGAELRYVVEDALGTVADEVDLQYCVLDGANLRGAKLSHLNLAGASFVDADLEDADLSRCNLTDVSLAGADLANADLSGSILKRARLFTTSSGSSTRPSRPTVIAEARWDGATLELAADLETGLDDALGQSATDRIVEVFEGLSVYGRLRAHRQLARALRERGEITLARQFEHGALRLQRATLGKPGRAGSWLIDALTGYGYKLHRIAITYALVVGIFAIAYGVLGMSSWIDAVWFSMIAFHGRGVINTGLAVNSPLLLVPALEAVTGLMIEAVLVAALVRGLFRE